jgi:hypothetical protein
VKSCVEALEAFVLAHPDVADTPELAAALAAARAIDDPRNSTTPKSMMITQFLRAIEVLRLLAPEKAEVSPLDEIKQRREGKLRRSDAKDRVETSG